MSTRIIAVIAVITVLASALKFGLEFDDFQDRFNRTYLDESEKAFRYSVFAANMKRVEELNARPGATWVAGVTKFSDLTPAEFRRAVGLWTKKPEGMEPFNSRAAEIVVDAPDTIDWRKKNAVTRVKNQASCGSCWAFSATGVLESATAIKTGKLVELSEQNLVDCSGEFGNMGCGGGMPSWALSYVKYNKGQDTEESYPYTGYDGSCQFSSSSVGATVLDVVNITQGDETGLKTALGTVGPVSVCFDVSNDLANYHSGVYSSDECSSDPMQVNHAVLAVGYDTTASTPYLIVKNSWGEDFGINGYFWIEYGKNMCGIGNYAVYPTV